MPVSTVSFTAEPLKAGSIKREVAAERGEHDHGAGAEHLDRAAAKDVEGDHGQADRGAANRLTAAEVNSIRQGEGAIGGKDQENRHGSLSG